MTDKLVGGWVRGEIKWTRNSVSSGRYGGYEVLIMGLKEQAKEEGKGVSKRDRKYQKARRKPGTFSVLEA